MSKRRLFRPALFLFSALLPLASVRAQVNLLITEVMADNRNFLADEDKQYPDWIEILNAGSLAVDLEGYFLSDNPKTPDKWAFPAVNLGPGRFLQVFCSGKDRYDPASELHTSFKIAKEGGKVVLAAPDLTIISTYTYPEQPDNTSNGISMETDAVSPVVSGALARRLVLADGTLGTEWTKPEFDDGAWKEGPTPIGYGMKIPVGTDVQAEMKSKNASICLRIHFDVVDPAAVGFMTLRAAYDDGFVAYLNGEEVARRNAPSNLQWNSRATAGHDGSIPEDINITGYLGLLRQGPNVLAIQALNYLASDTDFYILPALELVSLRKISPDVILYFPAPTPGRPNNQGFPQMAPRPVFSEESRAFTASTPIGISTTLEGASIHYTLDSTLPTEASPLYTAPIQVAGTTKITARVFKDGYLPGIAEGRVYLVLAANVKDFHTNLPLIICSTMGKTISNACGEGPYTPGVIFVIEPREDGSGTSITDPARFADAASFRKRGSSTCGYEKFAFNVQILDEGGLEKRVKILDFPVESDYIMHGSTNFDRSDMRNPIAYWMSREVGRWAPRTRFAECYFQGSSGTLTSANYFGIYAWMEKIKGHPEKVDIQELTLTDNEAPWVEGGYILKRDRASGGEVAITAGGYGSLVFVDPKSPSAQQRNYITNFLNKMATSLTPNIGSQLDSDWIDVNSWLDNHILNWYPKNVDAYRLSAYLFKKRDWLIEQGPIWDYDRTMGCADDDRARDPDGWDNLLSSGDGGTRYFQTGGMGGWHGLLFQNQPPTTDTPWNRAYKARWRELRRGPLSTKNIMDQLDAWGAELSEAGPRNAQRWGSQAPRYGSFQGEVNHLKSWLEQRAAWIDLQFIAAPTFTHAGGLVERGLQVGIIVESGEPIYYTLDGTDPKGVGNMPSATAVLYAGPITIDRNLRISARALEGGASWSGLAKDTFVVEIPQLMVTEIMYTPPAPTPQEDPGQRFFAYHMEFFEIKNVGESPVPLAGIRFSRGLTFDFTKGTVDHLDPEQIAVVVSNKDAFAARYGTAGITVAGQYSGSLSDTSARIGLVGPLDEVIFDFTYYTSWYPETRGGGYSLVNVDPTAPAVTLNLPSRWRPSLKALGTPGTDEPPSGAQRPGDLNRDGGVNIADVIGLIFYLVGTGWTLPCDGSPAGGEGNLAILDWDGSRAADFGDAVYSLTYLYRTGPPHVLGQNCVRLEGCSEACVK